MSSRNPRRPIAVSLIASAVALAMSPSLGLAASETQTIASNGKPMFVFTIDRHAAAKTGADTTLPEWSLTDAQLKGVLDAAEIWAGLFAPGSRNSQAIPFNIKVENDPEMVDNASASAESWTSSDQNGREVEVPYLMAGILYDRMPESAEDKAGVYTINQTTKGAENGVDQGTGVLPFIYPVMTVDMGKDITSELFSTTFHELSHALGIASDAVTVSAVLSKIKEARENFQNPPSASDEQDEQEFEQLEKLIVDEGIVSASTLLYSADPGGGLTVHDIAIKADDTPFSDHLVSYWARQAGGNTYALDYSKPTRFLDKTIVVYVENVTGELLPSSTLDPNKLFVSSRGQSSGVYFVGANVSETLAGTGLAGIPVNGWEGPYGTSDRKSELSHFELAHSMMSHQSWRNYIMLMEAELAAFQDMGYTIDRRNWFGASEYGSNKTYTNTKPFYARNSEGTAYVAGTPNTATLATGFHIYGSGNTITQAADLLADGAGAAGIRIDGIENSVTLARGTRITANGAHGTGILVAYGSGHSVDVAGSVEATGTGGRAISFDFGVNTLGDADEMRGSYIHKVQNIDGDLTGTYEGYEVGLKGPMAKLDVSGSVKGAEAAIYIGKRALVQEINILSGATLQGDILSAWNPKSQYLHEDSAGQNLTTSITFGYKVDADGSYNADPNFRMAYSGDIRWLRDQMDESASGQTPVNPLKVEVAGGTLSLSGNVDVQSLKIEDGATLALGNAAGGKTIQTEVLRNRGMLMTAVSREGALSGSVTVTDPDNSRGGTWLVDLADGYYQTGTAVTLHGSPVVDENGSPSELLESMTTKANSATLGVQLNGSRLVVQRAADAYSRLALDASARAVGLALDAAASADAVRTPALRFMLRAAPGNSAATSSLSTEAQELFGAIDGMTSAAGVSAALKKLSPEAYGYADAASIRMHREVSRDLHRHLRESRETGQGPISALQTRDWTGFVTPYGERFIGNAQGAGSATRSTSGGILGGLEKTDASGLTLGFHGGIGGRHQTVSTWHDARIDSAGAFAGVHAQFEPEGWNNFYLMGSARVGIEENRSKRTVAFGSYEKKAKGKYTSWTGEAMVGLGKDWKAGGVTFGPFASFEYIRTEHQSFKEKNGGGASLSVSKDSNDALGAMLGAHVNVAHRASDGLIVRAGLSGAYRRELLSTDYTARASFRDLSGSDSFTSHSRAMGRNSVLADASVGIANSADTLRAELTAGYEGANTGNAVRFGIRGQYRF